MKIGRKWREILLAQVTVTVVEQAHQLIVQVLQIVAVQEHIMKVQVVAMDRTLQERNMIEIRVKRDVNMQVMDAAHIIGILVEK